MPEVTKYVAVAKIVNPSLVSARMSSEGGIAHNGSIYCEIPEMGFFDPDLIYCRYGLSLPYIKIQPGWTLWVEPSVDGDSRWVYTGIADCGGSVVPADTDQMILQFAAQMIYASTAGKIHLSSKTAAEPFVLGTQLETYIKNLVTAQINVHTHPYTDTPAGPAVTGPPSAPMTEPVGILSVKIMGE